MGYCLNVPFVTQLGIGAHASGSGKGIDDPTGCWYASASMVAFAFEAGPRLGVPALYKPGLGSEPAPGGGRQSRGGHQVINVPSIATLKANEGLADVVEPADKKWTASRLEKLLRQYGPVFFGWRKTHNGQTYGHASVIVGVSSSLFSKDKVIIHDPENRPFFSLRIVDVNHQFIWGAGFTLRRAGNAYQHTIPQKT